MTSLSKSALLSPICVALLTAGASAQSTPAANSSLFLPTAYSSSSTNSASAPEAPAAAMTLPRPAVPFVTSPVQPFSALAVTAKVGSGGIGVDLATPLSQHFGLRTGASFLSYSPTLTVDGLNINGAVKLQSAASSLDIYPFHNSFRISPGFSFANHNRMNANLSIPAGQSYSFGDAGSATSDPSDPIHGTGSFVFGKTLAPRLTMGWGNIIPRKGSRVTFPVELGFQYTAAPTVRLNVTGSGCGSYYQYSGCGPVDQTAVAQEQLELQTDLNPLRFYPVASLGVSVRFGRMRHSD